MNNGVALSTSEDGTPETSTIIEQIAAYDNLDWAYRKTQKNRGKHTSESLAFDRYRVTNLEELSYQLLDGTYTFGDYRRKIIYEPKRRIIDVPELRDKIVQHAWNNIVKHHVFPRFIHDSYACIDGKGTHKAVDRLRHFMRKANWMYGDPWIIKMDFRKFFYSIDREHLLIPQVERLVPSENAVDIAKTIIRSASKIDDLGIPLGNPSSHIFSNMAVNPLDQHVKRQMGVQFYLRYADDTFAIVNGRQEARRVLAEMKRFAREELRLSTNSKTKIFPINQGLNALGFKVYTTHALLRDRSKRDIKRKAKAIGRLLRDGKMSRQTAEQMLNSWAGHAKYANSFNFIEKLVADNPHIQRDGDALRIKEGYYTTEGDEAHDLFECWAV